MVPEKNILASFIQKEFRGDLMDPNKSDLILGEKELFVHDESDLADYNSFFEFVIGNGEMMGRIDALHSQHLRYGAKKDVLCIRSVDVWGERTYPVHRGRPSGRFISKLEDKNGNVVDIQDLTSYHQKLELKEGILYTNYSWKKGESSGENHSAGFMSKVRKHIMVHKYVDKVKSEGWTRTFTVETIFPYHSRATVFYFNKPYNSKRWSWGEVEHENEVDPVNNAKVKYDPAKNIGIITFSTTFPKLRTRVVWVLKPSPKPDEWEVNKERGSLTMRWHLSTKKENEVTVIAAVMTDRDAQNYIEVAKREAEEAFSLGWDGLKKEHIGWWREELKKSSVSIPDEKLQKLYDISMYYLLINVGGSYWGFIGVDNVIYETCMCDNIAALTALIETNHLDVAQKELELLNKYLPAAKKNAAERMKFVLGITNYDAALLPFYMTEDGIELWQDNVFGMYTSMSGFHFLALLKTGRYKNDETFLREHAYPWFRSYAEYGRLNAVWNKKLNAYIYPIQNMGGGGEGYWYRITMSRKLYYKIFAEPKPLFRFCDFAPINFFPKEEISKLSSNWIDVVSTYMWILEQTAYYAEKFGLDAELRRKWKNVASNLYVPQNDQFFLSNIGADAEPSIGGPAVGGLFWPSEGFFEKFDKGKVERTFQEVVKRKRIFDWLRYKGRAWGAFYGIFGAYMKMGEEAYQCLKSFYWVADPRGIEMRESIGNKNYYYLLNYGSLVLLTRYMLLQTYNNKIVVFPAIPESWRISGVKFTNLPAEGGYLVNGKTNTAQSEINISDREENNLVRFAGKFRSLEITPVNLDIRKGDVQFHLNGEQASIEVTIFNVEKGRKYLVKSDGQEKIIKAGLNLNFSVNAPSKISVCTTMSK